MVFIGDDVEAYLTVEGRQVWSVSGRSAGAVQCPSCAVIDEVDLPPTPELTECAHCDATVRLVYLTAYCCSECGEYVTERGAFLRHVEQYHPPTM